MRNRSEEFEQDERGSVSRDWIKIGLAVVVPLLVHGVWIAASFKEVQVDLIYSKADRIALHQELKEQCARLSKLESQMDILRTQMDMHAKTN